MNAHKITRTATPGQRRAHKRLARRHRRAIERLVARTLILDQDDPSEARLPVRTVGQLTKGWAD